jgi:hypothetical protein
MEIWPWNRTSSPVRSTVKWRAFGADGACGIAGVWVVDRFGVLVALEGQALSHSLAAWIRKKTGLSEELRANLIVYRFDSETKRNVALIFPNGYPRNQQLSTSASSEHVCVLL